MSQQGCNLEKTTPVQNVGVFTTGIDGRICSDDGWNSAQYAWQSRECSRAHGHLVRVFTSFRLCPKLGIEFILPVTAKSSNPRSNDFRHTKIMAGGACFHLFYNFGTLKFGCSTCLAVAGDDFCIVAADSRLSVGYSILSRTTPKASQLTQHCVIASSGCNSDQVLMEPLPTCLSVLNSSLQVALHKLLKFKMKM